MLGVIVSIEGECKMREYVKTVINKKVERTVEALKRHGFNATFANSKEDAFSLVTSLVQKGKLIGVSFKHRWKG